MQSYTGFQRFKGQPHVKNGQPLLTIWMGNKRYEYFNCIGFQPDGNEIPSKALAKIY